MQRRRSASSAAPNAHRRVRSGSVTQVFKRTPLALAIITALHGAHAQQAPQTAQTQQAESGALQEVIVTASKRTENIQDVPIAVTALDTQKLEEMHIQSFTDYAQALPEVSFQTLQPGFARIFMRGIASDNNPNHSGPLPSVGTYLDEQPITTIQGPIDLHIYDIARVEVLPGPQGTLYGASSEAGTIRIITNKPDPTDFKAGYDLQANDVKNGTLGGIGEGFVNIPLATNAALRLVGWYERDSGYINNVHGTLTYPATDTTLDNANIASNHYNPLDVYGARAALKVDLNDAWTVMPVLIAQKSRWGGIFAQEDWKDLADGSAIPSELSVKHFYPEGGQDDWIDAALTIQGRLGGFDLTYAGSYLKRTDHTNSDYSDYSLGYEQYAAYWPNNPTQLILGTDRYQMYSNELRLASPKDWPVRFVVGAYDQRQQHGIQQDYVINGLDPVYWVGAGTPYQWTDTWWLTEQVRVNRDYAAFGEMNWDITNALTLTAGIRRFRYHNTIEGFYGFGLDAFGTDPTLAPASTLTSLTEGQQTCFINTQFHGAPCEDLDKSSDGEGWTPKFNLSYKFDTDHMIYATYSKGFRPGGVNRVGAATPYQADFLTNYEIGWKTTWLDHHLRYNGAAFYEEWKNFQFSFLGPNSVTVVANAGQARVKGVENELEWVVGNGLSLSVGGAYIDAYLSQNYCGVLNPNGSPVTDCPNDPLDPNPPLAPSGQQLPTTPRFKGNLTARYTFPLMDTVGHVQASYAYQTSVWPDLRTLERTELGQQAAYGLLNLSFGAEWGKYSLELIVKNALDKRADEYRYAECTPATCAPIATYETIAQPRLIGVQFSQRF